MGRSWHGLHHLGRNHHHHIEALRAARAMHAELGDDEWGGMGDPRHEAIHALRAAGRRHRGGHGGPPFGGFGGFGGFPRSLFGRGFRARRGDVRAAILLLLEEQPRNGYQILQELEARSHGHWRPSPGSVYPTLQQLEDEGLIQAEQNQGSGRTFDLTDAGRAHVKDHRDGMTPPWESFGEEEDLPQLMGLIRQVAIAAAQVSHAGTPAQVKEARELMADTRRALYRILSRDDEGTDD